MAIGTGIFGCSNKLTVDFRVLSSMCVVIKLGCSLNEKIGWLTTSCVPQAPPDPEDSGAPTIMD